MQVRQGAQGSSQGLAGTASLHTSWMSVGPGDTLSHYCYKGVKSTYKTMTGDPALHGEGLSAFLLRLETSVSVSLFST